MNSRRAYGNGAEQDAPYNVEGSLALSDMDTDFEQIPFGPEDDAPIDDVLTARWQAKLESKRAARAASQALSCDNSNGISQNGSAPLEAKDRDLAAAIAALDEAIKATPDDPALLFQRGNLHMRLGRYDLALQDYTSILQAQARNSIPASSRGIMP